LVVNVVGDVGKEAGFQTGDILLSLNGQITGSVEQFNEVVSGLPMDQVIPALVERNERKFFLTVAMPNMPE